MSRNPEEIKESKAALVAHILGALAYIAVGVCLFTLDTDVISRLVYSFSVLAVGILFICFGAFYMIKYFFNHEFKRITNYGFTMGVILVIIGAVFIFKADAISAFIDVLVCLIALIFGAIMLQESFALFHMQRGAWVISLLLGFCTIAASVYMLLTPFTFFTGDFIPSLFLVVVGGVSLFSLLLMVIGLGDHKKDSKKNYNRNMEDSNIFSKNKVDDSIFEEEPAVDFFEDVKEEPAAGSDALFEE